MSETAKLSVPDFGNTQIAFQNKTDKELKRTEWLFKMMNQSLLVDLGTPLTRLALKIHLPLVKHLLKETIYKQFCGGEYLMDCQDVIDHLYKYNALSILDYGVEGKSDEEDHDKTKNELINAIKFAASNNSVPVVSTKLTGLVDNDILIKRQSGEPMNVREKGLYKNFVDRVDEVCECAFKHKVGVYIDAEESWMQDAMDEVVRTMMEKYNVEEVIVSNTYQLYCKNKLDQLKSDHQKALADGYLLGAKLVRGAYMEKERDRAIEEGYPSPIQDKKEDTDRDFNAALMYCLDHYKTISFCCASHNSESNLLLAKEVIKRNLQRDHRHINFCQLQGMSDHITFNLAISGFNVAKYIVYGPVNEVIEYLIRRAEENTSVSGGMSRELQLISQEIKRRGL